MSSLKNSYVIPPLWLIILVIALPQLSETIYTPSLPDIAEALKVSDNLVEYTLTIYLFGFAIGVLIWGMLSDKIGRKPSLLIGLSLYCLGCIGCWLSTKIDYLMLFRFIQAFGGSTGSVLGQAIARDSFPADQRGKIFSTIGMAISISPALGPIIGGFTDQYFGWAAVFIVLLIFGLSVTGIVAIKMPETKREAAISKFSLRQCCFILIKDKRILSMGFFVGACNGIMFSLYSEGPFYLIKMLHLTPSQYGLLYIFIAIAYGMGGWLSRHFHTKKYSYNSLIFLGTIITLTGTLSWVLCAYFNLIHYFYGWFSVGIVLLHIIWTLFGTGIIIPNCLGSALENYGHMAGTAASIFGFYYYILISFMTFVMGIIHNGTVYPMPIYFAFLSSLMLAVYYFGLYKRN